LSTHLRLSLPRGLFPSGFPTNILYAFPFSSFVLFALPISSSLAWSFWLRFFINLICIVGVESSWVHSTLQPLLGLLCQARVIMIMEILVEWLAREPEVRG
jgi:hypothetical protein